MPVLHKRKTDELMNIGLENPNHVPYSRITLASVESLTLPLVQEVVLLADFRCKGCQERVADIMSRMNGVTESVVISVMDKKVTLTSTYPGIVKVRRGQVTRIYENSKNKWENPRLYLSKESLSQRSSESDKAEVEGERKQIQVT